MSREPLPTRRSPSLRSLAAVVVGGALYGAALGAWHGPRLALYTALKLPLVLLGTAAATFVFNVVAAAAFGAPARPREVAGLTLSAMAVAAVLLASLAPVVLLFDVSLPRPGAVARTVHNQLYLFHTAAVGACGLAGTVALGRALRSWAGSAAAARKVLAVWVLSLALVGGEVAWALRPFVGSVYEPVAFLRRDAFDGNVYEFIWTDIRPHLLGIPTEPHGEKAP